MNFAKIDVSVGEFVTVFQTIYPSMHFAKIDVSVDEFLKEHQSLLGSVFSRGVGDAWSN